MTGKQNARVLDWLRRWGSITDTEARDKLKISRVGARIYDLRKRGHDILTERIPLKDAPAFYRARYVLIAEAKAAA